MTIALPLFMTEPIKWNNIVAKALGIIQASAFHGSQYYLPFRQISLTLPLAHAIYVAYKPMPPGGLTKGRFYH